MPAGLDPRIEALVKSRDYGFSDGRRYHRDALALLEDETLTDLDLAHLLTCRPSPDLETLVAVSRHPSFGPRAAADLGRAWSCHGFLVRDSHPVLAELGENLYAHAAVSLSEHWWFSDASPVKDEENCVTYASLLSSLVAAGAGAVETAVVLMDDEKPAKQHGGNSLVPGLVELAILLAKRSENV